MHRNTGKWPKSVLLSSQAPPFSENLVRDALVSFPDSLCFWKPNAAQAEEAQKWYYFVQTQLHERKLVSKNINFDMQKEYNNIGRTRKAVLDALSHEALL